MLTVPSTTVRKINRGPYLRLFQKPGYYGEMYYVSKGNHEDFLDNFEIKGRVAGLNIKENKERKASQYEFNQEINRILSDFFDEEAVEMLNHYDSGELDFPEDLYNIVI
ncbi:hypothetical protein D2Q93_09405 [Alicyclobacillaceae bacterium I2511]|nr:hypothetical protein D2Q93_09405 [Alicyclobacillaceae bacterium I2511]